MPTRLVLLAVLLAAAASAGPAGAVCTEAGCAHAYDRDRDGVPDEATFASGGEAFAVGAQANRTDVTWQAWGNTDDHEERYLVVGSEGNVTFWNGSDDRSGFRSANVTAGAREMEGATGNDMAVYVVHVGLARTPRSPLDTWRFEARTESEGTPTIPSEAILP